MIKVYNLSGDYLPVYKWIRTRENHTMAVKDAVEWAKEFVMEFHEYEEAIKFYEYLVSENLHCRLEINITHEPHITYGYVGAFVVPDINEERKFL